MPSHPDAAGLADKEAGWLPPRVDSLALLSTATERTVAESILRPMFNKQKAQEGPPPLLAAEGAKVAALNKEGYAWLGERYAWYNKIRTAKKGGLKLLADPSLEEQMEATRSALNLVTRTLNTGLMNAFNATIDSVKNAGAAPEEQWPAKIEGDRSDPPPLSNEQDALVLAWMPLKFANLAKPVRDKGKGLDFYSDGLIKKLYFKVVGFYCDPRNWNKERLGYFLLNMNPEANLQEIQGKLGVLKSEVDQLVNSLAMFRFGRNPRRKDAGQKNTMEETFEISDKELVNDLYLQSLLVHGLEMFIFRYYLTLMECANNSRALRQISLIFHPLLKKMEEIKQRFQGSFLMEREKIRLRKPYMEFFKQREALPPVQTLEENGRQIRRINHTHRLLEMVALPRTSKYGERQEHNWKDYLNRAMLSRTEGDTGVIMLIELLNTMVLDTVAAMEGKVAVAISLRQFADEQEKLGKAQLEKKKKNLAELKRKKAREKSKFKIQKQDEMVKTIEKEAEEMEAAGNREIEQMEEAIAKRREGQIARVEQLEMAAKTDREKNTGLNAARLYHTLSEADTGRVIRTVLVQRLVQFINENNDDVYFTLYRNLFMVMHDLFPTEKMLLRSAVHQKFTLEEHEMKVSDEELQAYQGQIESRKAELEAELPGVLSQSLSQGPVRVKAENLLELGLTGDSLRLLFSLPFNAPNKPASKLPPDAMKKLLMLNQLKHPLPAEDIVLPNVDAALPPLKRVNFNRLQKLMG